jgi:chloramphenicol 3-O phosphotransferase
VPVDAIVLNGGSSSGKSTLARCLQDQLGPMWLTLGVDDLVRALFGEDKPVSGQNSIEFRTDGSISVDDRSEAPEPPGIRASPRSLGPERA